LREAGDEVYASDLRLPTGAADGATWSTLDVTDAEAIEATLAEIKPDRVFHLAAILSARGEANPQLTYAVNQGGLYNMLEACRKTGTKQLMFTSTIAVFGPGLPDPAPDDVPLAPTTMYGVTKASGEMLGAYYAQRYGLDFRGVRFPGLISATVPGGGSSDYALFFYVDGVRTGNYTAFCRPDTRIPLMYMPDGIRAMLELSDADRPRLRRCVYNIAAFSPTAQVIADEVSRALDGAHFSFEPDRVRQDILDSWPNALDDSAARREWDWAPQYDLQAMTAHLIPEVRAMLKAHPEAFAKAHGA
jgi:threonine 3-dehydrogenase